MQSGGVFSSTELASGGVSACFLVVAKLLTISALGVGFDVNKF